MPTGYTEIIERGASFEEFVWRCARAFGALVTMREDPIDAAVPDELKPDTYHRDSLTRARAKLSEIEGMSEIACAAMERHDREVAEAAIRESVKREAKIAAAYGAMAEKVRAWEPPKDHADLKRFMLEQIKVSHPGDPSTWARSLPVKQSPDAWKKAALKSAREDVDYHEREWRKEQERTRERNEWIAALRKSVPQPKPR